MINVGQKSPTERICLATGKLLAQPSTLRLIQSGTLPKGNALPLAEAAGIIAVKKTSEILPLCHPLPIDAAQIQFQFEEDGVRVFCEVSAHAKTGVEMEALNGVNAALLCIYDLTKGVDPALALSDIHLIEKRGGKSGLWRHPKATQTTPLENAKSLINKELNGVHAEVITLSDRCFKGESIDQSGPFLMGFLSERGASASLTLIPDEATLLRSTLLMAIQDRNAKLILLTGGTGVGPRDITPETVASLNGKLIAGFGELIRSSGSKHTPLSYLSRAEAFILNQTLLICLPGSLKGAKESIEAIEHLIPHTLKIVTGARHS